jgi:tRNA-binding EMAP/Myf-like protein
VYCPVPAGITSGVVVGRIVGVRPHPNADSIRLARVDLGIGEPVQIVFGGPPNVHEGDLVPVAPPGSRIPGKNKMRRRHYRGESSYGMLCSLAELGWNEDGPDEVALLCNVTPGDSLDKVAETDWQSLVINTTSTFGSNPIHGAKPLPSLARDRNTADACVEVSSHTG